MKDVELLIFDLYNLLIMVVWLKSLSRNMLKKNRKYKLNIDTIKTNAQSIIGKKGLVTKDINSIKATGQVKIEGELWSAIGKDDMDIPKGTEVEVNEIKGVKVIVTPIK